MNPYTPYTFWFSPTQKKLQQRCGDYNDAYVNGLEYTQMFDNGGRCHYDDAVLVAEFDVGDKFEITLGPYVPEEVKIEMERP